MKQLPLPISWAFSTSVSDFVVDECNKSAFMLLEQWPLKIKTNFVCLVGETGSGKTHLAHVWADRLGAKFITSEYIENVLLDEPVPHPYYVLDNADEICDDILLFNLYNKIRELDAYMLMTAKQYPAQWHTGYDDVKSRLKTIDVITIKKPNEVALTKIINQMLLQRGIMCSSDVIAYISNRIERTYESMIYWVNRIDEFRKTTHRKITLKAVRAVLTDC